MNVSLVDVRFVACNQRHASGASALRQRRAVGRRAPFDELAKYDNRRQSTRRYANFAAHKKQHARRHFDVAQVEVSEFLLLAYLLV